MDLRARIAAVIGAGSAIGIACGGGGEIGSPADAAADSAGGDASRSDAAGDAVAMGDANADTAPSGDTGADACSPGSVDVCVAPGQSCNQDCDCCNHLCLSAQGGPCNGASVCACLLTVRRPFLVGSSLRVAGSAERSDWQLARDVLAPPVDLDPATAEALARDWLRDACEEHASIAAFARFTMHMMSVGAPPEMILASQGASRDEVRHARACFALARRYSGMNLGPSALSLEGAMTPMTLAEIAALTAEEGCVGETLGALLAEEQLRSTLDPTVRETLARANIIADEARHAELAWRFVTWAVARGGKPVRRAVARAIRRAIDATLATPVRTYDGIDIAAWRAHGRVTCADARAVVERGLREIIEPCARALLAENAARAGARDGARNISYRDLDCLGAKSQKMG